MKKILLNWMPPSMENMPAPALSVLKSALKRNGFQAEISYWNLRLRETVKDFFYLNELIYDTEFNGLLPFLSYLAVECNDQELMEKLEYYLLKIKPQLHSRGMDFIANGIEAFHKKLTQIIDEYVKSIDWSDYLFVGFSSRFYQWIAAGILVERLKAICPSMPVMIGGFNTKNEAMAFMRNFPKFDYASWGEGEYSILKLCEFLDGQTTVEKIPYTIYHQEENLKISTAKNIYCDLDTTRFDFSDYIQELEKYPISQDVAFPIEGGRGCHWNRCHFCYLNVGYKSRTKSVDAIINELTAYIQEYGISTFIFLDNDIVGNDTERFNRLLDALISLKERFNTLTIVGVEVITRGLTYKHIQKMGIIGFQNVQIGYESPSQNILTKIEKKNTFASNLFFIKWALRFNMAIVGANVLKNLIEEETDDIKEGIRNLFPLRFFLSNGFFHAYCHLCIAKSSKYFKRLQSEGQLKEWISLLYDSLPKNLVKEEDKYDLILAFTKLQDNSLWTVFEEIEKHYISSKYDYLLFGNGNSVTYKEYCNGSVVNELKFEADGIRWRILMACNKQIQSVTSMMSMLDVDQTSITEESLKATIIELTKGGLLYHNDNFSEIVSVIDTDKNY